MADRERRSFDHLIPSASPPPSRERMSFRHLIPDGHAQQQENSRGSFADPLLQGFTMGLYDEGAGAVSGALSWLGGGDFNEAYDERSRQLRDDYDAYKERRPWAALGAEALGAAPTMLVPGGAMMRATTTAGRIGRGALAGAGTGTVYGYNQGEGNLSADRFGNAGSGAAWGAGAGAAVPAVGAGIRRGWTAAADRLRPNAATQAGIRRPAQRELGRVLSNDDMTVEELGQRVREYGPDAMPADASEALRNKADVLVHYDRPGAREHLRNPLRQRAEGRRDAAGALFDDVLGPQENIPQTQRRLTTQRAANARREYRAALDANAGQPVDVTPLINRIVADMGAESADDLVSRASQPYALPEVKAASDMIQRLTGRGGGGTAGGEVDEFASMVREGRPSDARPETLSSFLRRTGFDPAYDRGELDAVIGTNAGRARGFLRSGGFRGLDDAAERAHEAGYLNDRSPRELLDMLDEDLRHGGVYSRADEDLGFAWREYDEAAQELEQMRAEAANAPVSQRREGEPISDFRHLSRVQQLLYNHAQKLLRSADGQQQFIGRQLMNYHDGLVRVLDEGSNGLYSRARGQYRTDSEVRDALRRGLKALDSGEHPQFLEEYAQAIPPEARAALRTGTRDNARRLMSTSRGDLTTVQQLASPGTRIHENMAAVLGRDETSRVSRRAQGEVEKRKTEQIGFGSGTARRQADPDSAANSKLPLDTSVTGASARLAQVLLQRMTPDVNAGRARDLSHFLGSQGSDRDRLLQALLDSQAARTPGADAKSEIARLLMGQATLVPATVGEWEDIQRLRRMPTITVRPRPGYYGSR